MNPASTPFTSAIALPGLKSSNTFNLSNPNPLKPRTTSVAGTNQPTVGTPRNTNIPPVSSANLGAYKGVPITPGDQNSIMAQMTAIDNQPVPGENPPNVNLTIPKQIPGDALNGNPNLTYTSENNKGLKNQVLTNKYQKEEDFHLKNVSNLLSGIANLKGTQAREYAGVEDNTAGKTLAGNTIPVELARLSKDQSLELSARTGQLNAELDALKLYQGYAPSVMGAPQIDKVTGEAFVYMQDPSTGEITTQSLGQVMTPEPVDPYEGYQTLSEGESIFDPKTGQMIYKNPKTYDPKSGGGMGGTYGGGYGASGGGTEVDWENPAVIGALPVSQLTKAIMSGVGSTKDLTPTMKAQVLSEMYAVGYNPNQAINNKLNNLVTLWENMPDDQKGYLQGRKFWASSTVPSVAQFNSAKELLTRQVARLYDVGVLSDQDVKSYTAAMPARTDGSIDVVKSKLSGISQASTGKDGGQSKYPIGTEVMLDSGRTAKMTANGWVDPFTGQPITVD